MLIQLLNVEKMVVYLWEKGKNGVEKNKFDRKSTAYCQTFNSLINFSTIGCGGKNQAENARIGEMSPHQIMCDGRRFFLRNGDEYAG